MAHIDVVFDGPAISGPHRIDGEWTTDEEGRSVLRVRMPTASVVPLEVLDGLRSDLLAVLPGFAGCRTRVQDVVRGAVESLRGLRGEVVRLRNELGQLGAAHEENRWLRARLGFFGPGPVVEGEVPAPAAETGFTVA